MGDRIEQAIKLIKQMDASFGGTEIYTPLSYVLG